MAKIDLKCECGVTTIDGDDYATVPSTCEKCGKQVLVAAKLKIEENLPWEKKAPKKTKKSAEKED